MNREKARVLDELLIEQKQHDEKEKEETNKIAMQNASRKIRKSNTVSSTEDANTAFATHAMNGNY